MSMAVMNPRIVTARAASLMYRGIDRVRDLIGIKFKKISSPDRMLPQARRLMGLVREGLFSLIGSMEIDRGWCIDTKKIMRKL